MGGFPEDVKQFILDNITSVDQLEVLLLLQGSSGKEWTAGIVSQHLCTQPEAAASRLADLHKQGLLAVREDAERWYWYQPATGERSRLVNALADTYKERRVAVISLIYSERPNHPAQAFADAFRIRKEE